MKNLLIILTLLIAGCTSKQQVSSIQLNEQELSELEINIVKDENISFVIKNTTNELVYLYQPKRIYIEKLSNGSWEKLRILPCPCDAPCRPPKEKEELGVNESFNLNWNKEESWCGTERVNRVRNTVTKNAEKGTYRVRFRYKINENEIENIYKEFTIN